MVESEAGARAVEMKAEGWAAVMAEGTVAEVRVAVEEAVVAKEVAWKEMAAGAVKVLETAMEVVAMALVALEGVEVVVTAAAEMELVSEEA